MPRAGAVRQADAAGCFPELSGFAVQLVDIDCVQAEVADQDFIPVFVENGKVSVRSLLPVRRVVTDAAVLAEVAERTDRAVRIQIIEGDRSAAVTCDQKKFTVPIDTDVTGASACAGQVVQDNLIPDRVNGHAGGSFSESIQYFVRGERKIGWIRDFPHCVESGKGRCLEISFTKAEGILSCRSMRAYKKAECFHSVLLIGHFSKNIILCRKTTAERFN